MESILITAIISCNQFLEVANRLSKVANLNYQQKTEIIQTIREYIPGCPVIIKKFK